MSAPLRSLPESTLQRVEGRGFRRHLALSLALGTLGALEVTVVYLVVRTRLPSEVADHFGLTGAPNGSLPPTTLVGVELGLITFVSALFLLALGLSARSVPLSRPSGSRLSEVLLLTQAVIVVGILPLTSGLLFLSAAGVTTVSGPGLGLVLLAIGLLPLVGLLVVLRSRGRVYDPPALRFKPGQSPEPVFLGIGNPIALQCSSCGQQFRLSGVPLLAPHMPMGGGGGLYVRCPLCGERGWDAVLGQAPA